MNWRLAANSKKPGPPYSVAMIGFFVAEGLHLARG